MKVYLSMLLMGIVSSSSALLQSHRGESSKGIGRFRSRLHGSSGFVRLPGLLAIPGMDVRQEVERRFLMASTPAGRQLLIWHAAFRKTYMNGLRAFPDLTKRSFDFSVSLLLLILLSPLFALIGLLVKLQDGGPIFFAQTRVGRYGREFKMYKVRSMCLNAEQKLPELLEKNQHSEGVTFKLKEDPRITPLGRYLRKFSLDELPQLFNVLIGNMSLVGPRPPVPREVAKYSLADRRRLAVKPGITCIWQISGRSEIDFSGQVLLDVKYIENQTMWTDLKILVLTLPAVVSGKGAC